MAVQNLPFTLSTRKDSPFFFVRFKNEKTGKYLNAISTKKTDRNEALKTAWKWYSEGKFERPDREHTLEAKSISEQIRSSDVSDDDILYLIDTARQKGLIKSYVKAGDKNDVPLADYLLNFWTWEKSEYVQEKLRRGKTIGKMHVLKNFYHVKKYWIPYFKDISLGALTRRNLKDFVTYLQNLDVSGSTKNQAWLAGAQAIRYAYNNELIDRDITAGIPGFAENPKARAILTPEMAQAVFSVEWRDKRAYLANLLAMCTGMRSGEIRALRKQDLGRGCIYVNHSWNYADGLKSTKNGESRIVQLPFPQIIQKLLELANSNPFTDGMDGYIFYATVPGRPIESCIFRDGLHEALQKIGLPEEEAKKYCFHAWRHYYASYMKDRLSEKLLQSQTGHKTVEMLEHYASHKIIGDDEKIQQAAIGVFGDIVNHAHFDKFDRKELCYNVRLEYMDKSGMYEHSHQDKRGQKSAPCLTEKGRKAAERDSVPKGKGGATA